MAGGKDPAGDADGNGIRRALPSEFKEIGLILRATEIF